MAIIPDRPAALILALGLAAQPITTEVNGTFSDLSPVSTYFRHQSALIGDRVPETCVSLGLYGTKLLTMIKNVLIAAISFVSLTQ